MWYEDDVYIRSIQFRFGGTYGPFPGLTQGGYRGCSLKSDERIIHVDVGTKNNQISGIKFYFEGPSSSKTCGSETTAELVAVDNPCCTVKSYLVSVSGSLSSSGLITGLKFHWKRGK